MDLIEEILIYTRRNDIDENFYSSPYSFNQNTVHLTHTLQTLESLSQTVTIDVITFANKLRKGHTDLNKLYVIYNKKLTEIRLTPTVYL